MSHRQTTITSLQGVIRTKDYSRILDILILARENNDTLLLLKYIERLESSPMYLETLQTTTLGAELTAIVHTARQQLRKLRANPPKMGGNNAPKSDETTTVSNADKDNESIELDQSKEENEDTTSDSAAVEQTPNSPKGQQGHTGCDRNEDSAVPVSKDSNVDDLLSIPEYRQWAEVRKRASTLKANWRDIARKGLEKQIQVANASQKADNYFRRRQSGIAGFMAGSSRTRTSDSSSYTISLGVGFEGHVKERTLPKKQKLK